MIVETEISVGESEGSDRSKQSTPTGPISLENSALSLTLYASLHNRPTRGQPLGMAKNHLPEDVTESKYREEKNQRNLPNRSHASQ